MELLVVGVEQILGGLAAGRGIDMAARHGEIKDALDKALYEKALSYQTVIRFDAEG